MGAAGRKGADNEYTGAFARVATIESVTQIFHHPPEKLCGIGHEIQTTCFLPLGFRFRLIGT